MLSVGEMSSSFMFPGLLLVTLVSFASAATISRVSFANAATWTPCTDVEGQVVPTSLSVLPDPLVIGKEAVFTFNGTSSVEVPSGLLNIVIKKFGVQIHEEVRDLCNQTACPLGPGQVSWTNSELVPRFALPGNYQMVIVVQDANATELTCLNINFTLTWFGYWDSIPGASLFNKMYSLWNPKVYATKRVMITQRLMLTQRLMSLWNPKVNANRKVNES
jgi:hypothetical protein